MFVSVAYFLVIFFNFYYFIAHIFKREKHNKKNNLNISFRSKFNIKIYFVVLFCKVEVVFRFLSNVALFQTVVLRDENKKKAAINHVNNFFVFHNLFKDISDGSEGKFVGNLLKYENNWKMFFFGLLTGSKSWKKNFSR